MLFIFVCVNNGEQGGASSRESELGDANTNCDQIFTKCRPEFTKTPQPSLLDPPLPVCRHHNSSEICLCLHKLNIAVLYCRPHTRDYEPKNAWCCPLQPDTTTLFVVRKLILKLVTYHWPATISLVKFKAIGSSKKRVSVEIMISLRRREFGRTWTKLPAYTLLSPPLALLWPP